MSLLKKFLILEDINYRKANKSNKKRLTKSLSKNRENKRQFLKFVYDYRIELQILLLISSNIWKPYFESGKQEN